ncbi:MAG: hypothetical protein KC713_03155 [Candidatus Omnitrophica bacterium]|nr:hypothetical protein [Candidatus Omnitrophota bacterium]
MALSVVAFKKMQIGKDVEIVIYKAGDLPAETEYERFLKDEFIKDSIFDDDMFYAVIENTRTKKRTYHQLTYLESEYSKFDAKKLLLEGDVDINLEMRQKEIRSSEGERYYMVTLYLSGEDAAEIEVVLESTTKVIGADPMPDNKKQKNQYRPISQPPDDALYDLNGQAINEERELELVRSDAAAFYQHVIEKIYALKKLVNGIQTQTDDRSTLQQIDNQARELYKYINTTINAHDQRKKYFEALHHGAFHVFQDLKKSDEDVFQVLNTWDLATMVISLTYSLMGNLTASLEITDENINQLKSVLQAAEQFAVHHFIRLQNPLATLKEITIKSELLNRDEERLISPLWRMTRYHPKSQVVTGPAVIFNETHNLQLHIGVGAAVDLSSLDQDPDHWDVRIWKLPGSEQTDFTQARTDIESEAATDPSVRRMFIGEPGIYELNNDTEGYRRKDLRAADIEQRLSMIGTEIGLEEDIISEGVVPYFQGRMDFQTFQSTYKQRIYNIDYFLIDVTQRILDQLYFQADDISRSTQFDAVAQWLTGVKEDASLVDMEDTAVQETVSEILSELSVTDESNGDQTIKFFEKSVLTKTSEDQIVSTPQAITLEGQTGEISVRVLNENSFVIGLEDTEGYQLAYRFEPVFPKSAEEATRFRVTSINPNAIDIVSDGLMKTSNLALLTPKRSNVLRTLPGTSSTAGTWSLDNEISIGAGFFEFKVVLDDSQETAFLRIFDPKGGQYGEDQPLTFNEPVYIGNGNRQMMVVGSGKFIPISDPNRSIADRHFSLNVTRNEAGEISVAVHQLDQNNFCVVNTQSNQKGLHPGNRGMAVLLPDNTLNVWERRYIYAFVTLAQAIINNNYRLPNHLELQSVLNALTGDNRDVEDNALSTYYIEIYQMLRKGGTGADSFFGQVREQLSEMIRRKDPAIAQMYFGRNIYSSMFSLKLSRASRYMEGVLTEQREFKSKQFQWSEFQTVNPSNLSAAARIIADAWQFPSWDDISLFLNRFKITRTDGKLNIELDKSPYLNEGAPTVIPGQDKLRITSDRKAVAIHDKQTQQWWVIDKHHNISRIENPDQRMAKSKRSSRLSIAEGVPYELDVYETHYILAFLSAVEGKWEKAMNILADDELGVAQLVLTPALIKKFIQHRGNAEIHQQLDKRFKEFEDADGSKRSFLYLEEDVKRHPQFFGKQEGSPVRSLRSDRIQTFFKKVQDLVEESDDDTRNTFRAVTSEVSYAVYLIIDRFIRFGDSEAFNRRVRMVYNFSGDPNITLNGETFLIPGFEGNKEVIPAKDSLQVSEDLRIVRIKAGDEWYRIDAFGNRLPDEMMKKKGRTIVYRDIKNNAEALTVLNIILKRMNKEVFSSEPIFSKIQIVKDIQNGEYALIVDGQQVIHFNRPGASDAVISHDQVQFFKDTSDENKNDSVLLIIDGRGWIFSDQMGTYPVVSDSIYRTLISMRMGLQQMLNRQNNDAQTASKINLYILNEMVEDLSDGSEPQEQAFYLRQAYNVLAALRSKNKKEVKKAFAEYKQQISNQTLVAEFKILDALLRQVVQAYNDQTIISSPHVKTQKLRDIWNVIRNLYGDKHSKGVTHFVFVDAGKSSSDYSFLNIQDDLWRSQGWNHLNVKEKLTGLFGNYNFDAPMALPVDWVGLYPWSITQPKVNTPHPLFVTVAKMVSESSWYELKVREKISGERVAEIIIHPDGSALEEVSEIDPHQTLDVDTEDRKTEVKNILEAILVNKQTISALEIKGVRIAKSQGTMGSAGEVIYQLNDKRLFSTRPRIDMSRKEYIAYEFDPTQIALSADGDQLSIRMEDGRELIFNLAGDLLPDQNQLGGINMDPSLLDLKIRRDSRGVPLPVSEQPIENMRVEGFFPIIIEITPIYNLPMLLGFDSQPEDAGSTEQPVNLSKPQPYNLRQQLAEIEQNQA